MTGRIRWNDDDPFREYAVSTGSAGPSGWNWVPFGIYEEIDGPVLGLKTHFLTSDLPGQERRRYFGHPDDLKAEAERWLEEFIASLGAVFSGTLRETITAERERRNAAAWAADRVEFTERCWGWTDALDWVLSLVDQVAPDETAKEGR